MENRDSIVKNRKESVFSLSSYQLKIIALICMVIDHFGYYFSGIIPKSVELLCRCIGRLSMPIFLFLVVQGYFNTSNLKRYILRIFGFGVITQVMLIFTEYIGINYFKVISSFKLAFNFNVLFTLGFCLISIYFFECIFFYNQSSKSIIVGKSEENLNTKSIMCFVISTIVSTLFLFMIYILFKKLSFDYGYIAVIVSILMYLLERVVKKDVIKRQSLINLFLLLFIIIIFVVFNNNFNVYSIFATLSCFVIVMYNGKLISNNSIKQDNILRNKNYMKYFFYIVFPVHHFIMYFTSLCIHYLNM